MFQRTVHRFLPETTSGHLDSAVATSDAVLRKAPKPSMARYHASVGSVKSVGSGSLNKLLCSNMACISSMEMG